MNFDAPTNAVDWQGKRRQPCPACARGPKDLTLGVTVDDRGGVAHCFRCGHVERANERAGACHRTLVRTPQPIKHERLSSYGMDLWRACLPLQGVALEYLEARLCDAPPSGGALRFHPQLPHPVLRCTGPALVAMVSDAITGDAISLHRTWIKRDGTKADYTPARMLLGGHRKQGGVIRLWPEVGATLRIAEGIETALSMGGPSWSVIDAGNLAGLPVLERVRALVIGVDHDDAGIAAANECARRWRAAGIPVRQVKPDKPGQDLNDERRELAKALMR